MTTTPVIERSPIRETASSPILDRLATEEGRAHARAVLAQIRASDAGADADTTDVVIEPIQISVAHE